MSHHRRPEKDHDCKPPRPKKCDRERDHHHHGGWRKKCSPKHPWHNHGGGRGGHGGHP